MHGGIHELVDGGDNVLAGEGSAIRKLNVRPQLEIDAPAVL